MSNVGFIGLAGVMGRPMAGRLQHAGHTLSLNSRIGELGCTYFDAPVSGGEVGAKAGADPANVRSALMGGFAASRVLEVHGQRMIDRTLEPGFRIALHQKDLNLALSGARELGVALPNTAAAQELCNACRANGGAGRDHSAMIRALELLAAHKIGAAPVAAER